MDNQEMLKLKSDAELRDSIMMLLNNIPFVELSPRFQRAIKYFRGNYETEEDWINEGKRRCAAYFEDSLFVEVMGWREENHNINEMISTKTASKL